MRFGVNIGILSTSPLPTLRIVLTVQKSISKLMYNEWRIGIILSDSLCFLRVFERKKSITHDPASYAISWLRVGRNLWYLDNIVGQSVGQTYDRRRRRRRLAIEKSVVWHITRSTTTTARSRYRRYIPAITCTYNTHTSVLRAITVFTPLQQRTYILIYLTYGRRVYIYTLIYGWTCRREKLYRLYCGTHNILK